MMLVLFTDLDGTLLDERSYSYDAARPAVDMIRKRHVLLVPCTSKTCAEVWPLQDEMGIHHPFIVENGGAFYLPSRMFGMSILHRSESNDWFRVGLGVPYIRLTDFLRRIRDDLGISTIGFNDLSSEEIVVNCGLSLVQATRAKMREYDEPFLLATLRPGAYDTLLCEAEKEGFTISRGGRFYHLSGGCDKGKAVRLVAQLARWWFGEICTVGIGDSPNDIPMLKSVHFPVIVRRPDGTHAPDLVKEVPNAHLADGIGPVGWNEAVSRILKEMGSVGIEECDCG